MESVNLTVSAKNLTELRAKLETAFSIAEILEFNGKVVANLGIHPSYENSHIGQLPTGLEHPIATKIKEELKAAEEVKAEPVEAPKKEKKKRTVETAVTEQAVETYVEAPVETPASEPITKEAIAQALQSVSEKVNFQKAKEILTSYKNAEGNPCKKVSDVQASDYEAFMNSCRNSI